jgi:Protein of unknown function (DUF3667)
MSDMEAILETGAALGLEYAATRLAEQGKPLGNCANCGAPLVGPYCAMCGQEPDYHRRTIAGLAHDLFEDILSFDSRILRTAKALLFQPGELPLAFHQGRTRRYVPALRLYFFVSLIFFLVLGGFNIAIMQLQVVARPLHLTYDAAGNAFMPNPAYDYDDPDARHLPKLIKLPKSEVARDLAHYTYSTEVHFLAPIGAYHNTLPPDAFARLKKAQTDLGASINRQRDPKKRAQAKALKGWVDRHVFGGMVRLASNPAALNEPLTTWIPRILFLLLPLYALLLAAFYWRQRKKFYLVDHLIFSLSVHTFTFVVLLVAVGLAQILPGGTVFWLFLLSVGVYVLLAIRRFYQQSWFWSAVKTLAISGIYTCFFLLPALGGIVAYGFLYS